jgi:hypothetical protein
VDGHLEGPERYLDTEWPVREHNRVRDPLTGQRHADKVLVRPGDPIPPVTKSSQDVTSFFTKPTVCRVILNA